MSSVPGQQHGSIAEQLSGYRKQFPATTPRIRHVAQFVGELAGTGPDGITAARTAVLKWLERKAGKNLSKREASADALALDYPGFKLESFALKDPNPQIPDAWAARIEHPDTEVPARTWSVEIEVAQTTDGKGLFGARLIASMPMNAETAAPLSIPAFIRDVCRTPGLCNARRRFSGKAWLLQVESDLNELDRLLLSADRTVPVIVATQARDWSQAHTYRCAIDADELAQRTLGLAFVVVMPAAIAHFWWERVGKEWAVYDGAVRTYRAGLDRYADDPYDHRYANESTIRTWVRGEKRGADAFIDVLVNDAFYASVSGAGWRDRFASFRDLKQIQLNQARERAEKSGDVLILQNIHEDEIKAYKAQVNDALNQAVEYEEVAKRASEERNGFAATNEFLLHEVSRLKEQLLKQTGKSLELAPPIPNSLAELGGWSRKYLSGQIVIAERALREAKKSDFEEVELVYRALLLLAIEYRDMRLASEGDTALKDAFEQKCRQLKLDLPSGAISDTRLGGHSDQYFLPWPPDSIGKRRLEFHIGRGTSKQTRHTLRIYYFWDDERRQVIVGWLPSHLDTRMT